MQGANNTFFEATNPATPTPDATAYATTGPGTATLTFASGTQTYLGLLAGSIDSYNSINFFNGTTSVGSFTGTQIAALVGTTVGQSAYANFFSTIAFTSVQLSSTQNSFEFDNVAYGNVAVPEPSSLALCVVAGLAGLTVARKRAGRVVA